MLNSGGKHTFTEEKILPYCPTYLFDLVADVKAYPEFLPWCVGAEIHEQSETHMLATMSMGYQIYKESFLSHVTLDRPHQIEVTYEDGPFEFLNNVWRFTPVPRESGPAHTSVYFHVSFRFKSNMLNMLMAGLFTEATHVMVSSFEKRARQLARHKKWQEKCHKKA